MGKKVKEIAEGLLGKADIIIDGNNPWDIRVKNDRFYERVMAEGNLGLGESYMDGWWESDAIDEMITRILNARLDKEVKVSARMAYEYAKARVVNMQGKTRAFEIGKRHYDIGNDLYAAMLDSRMVYTCAYWNEAQTLNEAQEAKLDLVCRKIGLKAGDSVLDIGCGWGGFAQYAAEKYGAHVVGITVSKEQAALARKRVEGLPVEIRLQDYRDVDEQFDHIISLGMIEHVGYKNYRTYMEIVSKCLKDGGFFLIQTIGGLRSVTATDAWIEKYIFPNSMLPSVKQIAESIEKLFVLEDLHNFGADYDKTLMAWYKNFNDGWGSFKQNYSEQFYRMWKYYLLSCAGTFRSRSNQLWQLVLSKNGVPGGYTAVR
ncbi:cyclopropane fatty acyl phospholipid synthase [Patescibacteria group bacterium]|nr:cyclopropane fatty acyl phospholipid synthase [Patescibacteria group bacterium]